MSIDYMMPENGTGALTAATVAPAGPRIPKRTVWVDLPPEYEGFKARLWVNYPQRLSNEIASGDQDRIAAALAQIVVEHNGWLDEDGTPLPPSTDPAFWTIIPTELAVIIMALLGKETTRLPNSMTTRNGR